MTARHSVASSIAHGGYNDENHQFLIEFYYKTYVINLPRDSPHCSLYQHVSLNTNIPRDYLTLVDTPPIHHNTTYLKCKIHTKHTAIRGGKGGFGTLLKGQSKRAPNKQTMDFGACRDLNGRRLRHVNDEIKLQLLRGADKDPNVLLNSKSGIEGWYLDVPNWSGSGQGGTSNKMKRRMELRKKRQWEEMKQKQDFEEEEKRKKQWKRQEDVLQYAAAGVGDVSMHSMEEDVMEGLLLMKQKRQKKVTMQQQQQQFGDEDIPPSSARPAEEELESGDTVNDYNTLATKDCEWLCSVSGEILQVEETEEEKQDYTTRSSPSTPNNEKTGTIHIQSRSEFATAACIVFRSQILSSLYPNKKWYYEAVLQTNGLIQIGWALPDFFSSKTQEVEDGVGDDVHSYAFDGSRCLSFHAGVERTYGRPWKCGDVIGCCYDAVSKEISYRINGLDLGVAFTLSLDENGEVSGMLFPAFSFNMGQEIQIRMRSLEYLPKGYTPVWEVLESSHSERPQEEFRKEEDGEEGPTSPPPSPISMTTTTTTMSKESMKSMTKTSPTSSTIDLNVYTSPLELQDLGMQQLKEMLMALGVKCGGTLEQRAQRLFSLKGLRREDYPMHVFPKGI